MKGYWEKPEETAKRLRPGPVPGEQVLYTGDLCKLDDEGYLEFVGRMDDIIKSRGEKVAPKEVEGALVSIRGVKEAAVIGVPDESGGSAVKAFVVLDDGAALEPEDRSRASARAASRTSWSRSTSRSSPTCRRPTTGKIKKTGLA